MPIKDNFQDRPPFKINTLPETFRFLLTFEIVHVINLAIISKLNLIYILKLCLNGFKSLNCLIVSPILLILKQIILTTFNHRINLLLNFTFDPSH